MLRSPRRALLTLLASLLGAVAPTNAADSTDATETRGDSGTVAGALFEAYARLLEAHLQELETADGGLVSAFDYRAAVADPATADLVKRQHAALAAFDPETLDGKASAVAFWINAYNYFMLAHVLENPQPRGRWVRSVLDYGSLINRHRVFQRDRFDIGGTSYSLDGIEKGVLLGKEFAARGWKDARVHFAVNCASVGCPPLRRNIYTTENLDRLLTENVQRALNTPRHLRVEGDTLYLSRLFDWYEDDFTAASGSVRAFIAAHTSETAGSAIANTDRIAFIDYDWSLNEPRNFPEFSVP